MAYVKNLNMNWLLMESNYYIPDENEETDVKMTSEISLTKL